MCLVSNSTDLCWKYTTNLKPVTCHFQLILLDPVTYIVFPLRRNEGSYGYGGRQNTHRTRSIIGNANIVRWFDVDIEPDLKSYVRSGQV